ncbi:HK97-gp10 family putative phage morphogenesis protein [Clostridium guangxiense]|uniref:HK97-gp10 family putative phage morphogenesis protein n=1 Tax=Clostridium guangxiense TaxID=1662055 RepID=UPI001E45BB74|nr:HK97-gp10 family putative phage morphogenesis protein [Clostridium guangxiense]MCD2345814.1 HK97 gp10 family phage protein [Clostridium guangxiense]
MEFKSNIPEVLNALERSKKEICETIGTFVEGEAKLRAPVGDRADGDTHPGLMRRSITHEVNPDNSGVKVGTTQEAVNSKGQPYAVFVEKGTSKMAAQPFLEPACLDNINKLEEIAGQKLSINMNK